MSLLSLLMCGAIGMSAACETPSGDKSGSQENNSTVSAGGENNSDANTSTGGSSVDDEGNTTVKVEKMQVYEDVANSIELFATSGKAYQISVDISANVTDYEEYTDSGDPVASTAYTMAVAFDGDAYFQIGDSVMVDAIIRGHAEPTEVPYMYAAAYVRDDALYAGMTEGDAEITQTQIDAIEYIQESITEIIQSLSGGTQEEIVPTAAELPTDSVEISEDTVTVEAMVQALVAKAASGLFGAINGEVTTSGDTKTLTVDIKAEIDSIYKTAEALVNLIDEETTVNDLLASPALKLFFSKYFGTLTVEDLNMIFAMADTPIELVGENAYDAIVDLVKSIPVDAENPEAGVIGDMPLAEMKPQIEGVLAEVKAVLDTINSLKFSLSVTKDIFSGFSIDVDIEDIIDLSMATYIAEVEYSFVDVSKLNVAVVE